MRAPFALATSAMGRNLHDREEKPELPDCVRETFKVERLRHVDVSSQLITLPDLRLIVCRRQDNHWNKAQARARFDTPENFDATHVREIEVEEDEVILVLVLGAGEIGNRAAAVPKG